MKDMFFCMACYVMLATILLYNIKKNSKPTDADNLYYSLNCLRGLFALEIIIGHCVRYESSLLTPLGNFMLISVGYFFFISGFGISRSYHSKPDYLISFPKKRMLRLVGIAFFSLAVTTLIANIVSVPTPYASWPLVPISFLRALLIRNNWYLRELFILYSFFYTAYKYFNKYRITAVLILTIALCVILQLLECRFSLGYTRCWFASIICFPLGIIAYEKKDWLLSRICTPTAAITGLLIFVLGAALSHFDYPTLTGFSFETTEMIYAFFNNILCVGFIILLCFLLSHLKPGNIFLTFFTGISTSIYLYQFIFISITEEMQLSYPWKIAFTLTFDILLSVLISVCKTRLSSLFPVRN